MTLLTPDLRMASGARVVVNSLYDSRDPGVLTQDLLLVELRGGTFIDVSWFPEHDPNGAYVVTLLRDGESVHEVEEKSPRAAMRAVESLAESFSEPFGNVSCSGGQTSDFLLCGSSPAREMNVKYISPGQTDDLSLNSAA